MFLIFQCFNVSIFQYSIICHWPRFAEMSFVIQWKSFRAPGCCFLSVDGARLHHACADDGFFWGFIIAGKARLNDPLKAVGEAFQPVGH